MNSKPVRILQILMDIGRGSGVANVVVNWHRHIDRSRIQFDYLVCFSLPASESFEAEIAGLGGRVFHAPYRGVFHPFSFLGAARRIFKEHRYRTVHSHITQLNFFYFPLAKFYGVKYIIQHAHGTRWSDKRLNGWRNYLMLHAVWPLITHKLACSELAGTFWYGDNFITIPNAIDSKKFGYNAAVRAEKRSELGLDGKFVVGHAGRFSSEKNHVFLLEVFKEIKQRHKHALLLLAGNGHLLANIKELAQQNCLGDSIVFLGLRKDLQDLYQAMDVFVLPSLQEGFPVVALEAQACGLPCIFADTITSEVLLGKSKRLSLLQAPEIWAREILQYTSLSERAVLSPSCIAPFNLKNIAARVQDLYTCLEGIQ